MTGAVVLTVLAGLTAAWLWRKASQSWLIQLGWRFCTGLDLDGQPRPHRWRRRRIAGVRLSGVAVVFGLLYGVVVARTVTAWSAATVVLAGLVTGGWWVWKYRLRHLPHHWRYERPLQRRLAPMLEGGPPRLAIEPDRSSVKVWLPPEFTGTQREWDQIRTAVTVTVGLQDPVVDPQLTGRNRYAIYSKSEPPPAKVDFKDIRAAIEAAAEHEVILGLGKKDQAGKYPPIDTSLDSESPHLGFCMTTGDGKSMAAMNVSAQVLWHGGITVMLDYKLMSHMWARGLPNVAYAGTPSELHAMLCWLANDDEQESELTRRKQVALASADIRGNVTADIGPRMLVVAEELNVMQKILKAYWRKIGGRGPSPAAEALDELIFTGRQLRIHVLMIGQRLSAKATSGSGSADSRENLNAIVFSNPSPSTWKMLCDGHVQPPASDHKGRYQVVTRKSVREMQGALWDEEDARAYATAGTVAIPRHDMPFITQRVPVVVGQNASSAIDAADQPFVVGQAPDVPALPGAVTLAEAVAAGMWPTPAAARKAVQRAQLEDAGFRGAAKLYTIEALATARRRKADR